MGPLSVSPDLKSNNFGWSVCYSIQTGFSAYKKPEAELRIIVSDGDCFKYTAQHAIFQVQQKPKVRLLSLY